MKYRLGDITVKNWNSWDFVPRDPVTIGAAILGQTAATAFGAAMIAQYAVGFLVTTAITSWATNALTPKQDFSSSNSAGLQVNSREPAAAAQFVYGEVRKGGTITYYESTGAENKYLHQIIVLAAHEVNSIGDIYINDKVATLASNTVTTAVDPDDEDNTDNWDSKIYIRKFTGADDQDIYTALSGLTHKPTFGPAFKGQGVACLYVRYLYDADVFANGLPLITAVVQGKKVYDPRSGTTAYSNNSALCIRDFLTAEYGLNESNIDDTSFAAAANECDENVTLSDATTEKRYTTNGVISSATQRGQVFQQLVTSCAGTLFWGMGTWKLKVGVYSSSVKSLGLDDLRGPINLSTRTSMSDNFNTVRGTFNDADNGWVTADYPEISASGFVTEDNGETVPLDLELPFTTSSATAQRLAKLTLYRGREQMTFSADFGLSAFDVEVGDIIDITNSRYGWTNKEFEVVGWRLAANQDAGDLRVNLTLRETSEAAFSWSAEETDIIYNNTNLPVYNRVDAVTNLTLTTSTSLNDDGITIPSIVAAWDVSPNSFVDHYEIQYKRLGGEEDYGTVADTYSESEDWGSITVAATETEDYGLTNEEILTPDPEYSSVFGSSNRFVIEPILNGYNYIVRVRAINGIGVKSPFTSATIASAGDVTPPNEPLNLSAYGGKEYINLTWTNPADQDFNYVEVWENQSNNLLTATLIGQTPSNTFLRGNLGNNVTRYYWVRAVDYSLNKSDFTSSVNATTTLIAPDDFNDAVNDLFAEAGAFGVEPVSSLPASGSFDGQLVLLLPDITIYRWDATTSSWSTDIYTASSVEAGSITYTSFAAGIEPVGVVSALPTVAGYDGPQVVVLTTDGKLYRLVDGEWTAAVNTADIEGTIGANLFSDDLRPVERVATLPSTGLTQGRIVLLTSDNKMYRYTGSAWTAAVPAADVTGQITGTQIEDDAITTSKILAGSITASELAANSVTASAISAGAVQADALAANSVTANSLAANSVTADAISSNSVSTDALQANSVTTATIAAGAIGTSQLQADAVTADILSAGSVYADAIQSDAVTTDAILAGSIVTSSIAAGAVTANEISAGAITSDLINATDTFTMNLSVGDLAVDASAIPSSGSGAVIKSGGDLTVGNEDEFVAFDASSGLLTVQGVITNISDRRLRGEEPMVYGGITASDTNLSDKLDGAGVYSFVLVGGGGGGSLSDEDSASTYLTGGSGAGCCIFAFYWDGSTVLGFTRGNGGSGATSHGNGSNGSSSVFTYGGSTYATAGGGLGGLISSGNRSGGSASFNSVSGLSPLIQLSRTGGSALDSGLVDAGGGGGVDYFGTGANSSSGGDASAGGSPFGTFYNNVSTAPSFGSDKNLSFINDPRYLIGKSLDAIHLFKGGRPAEDNTTNSLSFSSDMNGGIFGGGGGANYNDLSGIRGGDGGYGGGGGALRRDRGSNRAGNGGNGILFWSKL